ELLVIRAALVPHAQTVAELLWQAAENSELGQSRRFRAAAALALLDPNNSHWKHVSPDIAKALLAENPIFLGQWLDALRPVRETLVPALLDIFRHAKNREEQSLALTILVDYAVDDPDTLSEMALNADGDQYRVIRPLLLNYPDAVKAVMTKVLARRL